MSEFRVRWVIDLEAENPKEAALEARRLQLKHDAQVGHFGIRSTNPVPQGEPSMTLRRDDEREELGEASRGMA